MDIHGLTNSSARSLKWFVVLLGKRFPIQSRLLVGACMGTASGNLRYSLFDLTSFGVLSDFTQKALRYIGRDI